VKGFVDLASADIPRIPLYQPYVNVAMQKNVSGYQYWFHRRLDDRYGYAAISAFRAARSPVGLMRTTARTVITAFGRDAAVASTLFYRESAPGKVGRQMQTWIRFPEGWRIAAAHVSIIDEPQDSR
jgi:hypothetical protein